MYYCALKDNGYIVGIAESETPFADTITKTEKNNVYSILCNKPAAPSGFEYRLRSSDLEWELVELQPIPEPELDPKEALSILLGGEGE